VEDDELPPEVCLWVWVADLLTSAPFEEFEQVRFILDTFRSHLLQFGRNIASMAQHQNVAVPVLAICDRRFVILSGAEEICDLATGQLVKEKDVHPVVLETISYNLCAVWLRYTQRARKNHATSPDTKRNL
jgi:hypothetical protein